MHTTGPMRQHDVVGDTANHAKHPVQLMVLDKEQVTLGLGLMGARQVLLVSNHLSDVRR